MNEGSHTGAGAISRREIFRKGFTPVPEKQAPTKDDFGGYGRYRPTVDTNEPKR